MADLNLDAPADLEICAEEQGDRLACEMVLRGARLERAVRTVMEELPAEQRAAARIVTPGPLLTIGTIEAIYRAPDFPRKPAV